MLRRDSLALVVLVVFVAVFAVGCSSTGALIITGGFSPSGTVGTPYYSTITVTGGTGTYSWTVANLPPGITASGTTTATLALSGTPTAVGTFSANATASDTKGRTDTVTSGITISTSPVLAINGSLPFTGSVGAAYSGTLTATGGTAPYTWVIDNLPPGLTPAGANTATLSVTGSPTSSGSFVVAITLTDSANGTAKAGITVAISSAAELAITGALPATGAVGAAYSGSLTATGGSAPYAWTISNLPPGVTDSGLDTATVSVAGSPTSAATYNVTALVTDSKQNTALYSVTVVVSAGQSAAESTCTTMPAALGNEAALTQPYAFVMSGTDENTLPGSWAGSFTPDGKGGIAAADVDQISAANGAAALRVNLEGSSYSFGGDGTGCLYLAFDGAEDARIDGADGAVAAHAPNRGLGGSVKSLISPEPVAGASVPATLAVRFSVNKTSRSGTIAQVDAARHLLKFGHIYAQTPAEFPLGKLSPRFAFGVDGWYIASASEIEHAAMAGSIVFSADTGALLNGVADNNIGGAVSGELSDARGVLTAASETTGRGTGSYTVDTARGEVSFDFAYYVIGTGDFILISTDAAQAGNFLLTGRALTAATPAPSLGGRYYAPMLGVDVEGSAERFRSPLDQLGKLEVSDDGSTNFTWMTGNTGEPLVVTYPSAITQTDKLTGRTTFDAPGGALPVAYLTANATKESIAGFLVGTDPYAASGTLYIAPTPFKP